MFGLSTHISPGDPDRRQAELELNRAAGVRILRRDFRWHVIEPEDDRFDFAPYDAVVDDAAEYGQELIGLLVYGVDWAITDWSHSSIDPAVFADYVSHTVEHFRGRVRYWEVWNEENWVIAWRPAPDPAAYGALLKAAYEAAKAADPECVVSFGGLAASDFLADEPWTFLEDVYAAHPDIGEYFDVLAIHPYTLLQQPGPEEDTVGGSVPFRVRHARRILERHGDGDKPIWITELGWPACPCPPVEPPARPVPNVSYEEQASYLVRAFVLAISEGADMLLWYTFGDGPGDAEPVSESYFGLVRYDADATTGPGPEPKPAYYAYATMTELLADLRFEGDLRTELGLPEAQYGFRFVDPAGGRRVDVLWAVGGEGEVVVPVDPGATVTVRERDGGVADVELGDGEVVVSLDASPRYVVTE